MLNLESRKVLKEIYVYSFPSVIGLEDISEKLSEIEADSLFSALTHVFPLKPIATEDDARHAERLIEYLDRVFEESDLPLDVSYYRSLLLMLLAGFDAQHYISTLGDIRPPELLRYLLREEGLLQKDLVPEIFKSASQVSEFLHGRRSRHKLFYQQAIALVL